MRGRLMNRVVGKKFRTAYGVITTKKGVNRQIRSGTGVPVDTYFNSLERLSPF